MKTFCFFLGLLSLVFGKQVTFQNNRGDTIWVGMLPNSDKPVINGGGFILNAGQSNTINFPDDWAGRYWGRTGCADGRACETGDCGAKLECDRSGGVPPATLAEFTFNGAGNQDYYDISLVDGFNVGVGIHPTNPVLTDDPYRCTDANCFANVNGNCPDQLRLDSNGQTVGCLSSCTKFNTDQYCCRGAYGQPETCDTNQWQVNSAAYFKSQCPGAYSYAYDDHKSTYTCANTDYVISFQ